jgi:cytochrome P450
MSIAHPRRPLSTFPDKMFDPTAPDFLANPYPALNALRESTAVLYDERLQRWFVTRHADVRACLRDRRLGRNFRHVGTEEEFVGEPLDQRWSAFWDVERWSLLWIEPPEHARIRKLVASAFTPRSVEALRAPARELANVLLTPLVARGQMELLGEFAQPYSIGIICRMLGVPLDRERDLLDWSHRMVKMYEMSVSAADARAANDAAASFRDYVRELLEQRRRAPADDMLTRLAEASVDGERLSDAEIVSTIVVLLNAGHEATVNTLGNGLLALMHHPAEWARLRDGTVSPANAVEEFIRWDPPLQLFERWVLADVEVGGVPIPRGQKVALLFGSANRDPRVFADPDRFDVGRTNAAEHIGFGGGIHACIGAPLARIELEASLGAIVDQVKRIELVTEPRRTGSFVIWGLDALELTLQR